MAVVCGREPPIFWSRADESARYLGGEIMKKFLLVVLVVVMSVFALVACSKNAEPTAEATAETVVETVEVTAAP